MLKIAKTNTGTTFRVRVQPGASKNEIMGVQGDALKVKINAPALKGKANKALVGFNDTSIPTHLLIRFDNEPEKRYNLGISSDARSVHDSITKNSLIVSTFLWIKYYIIAPLQQETYRVLYG